MDNKLAIKMCTANTAGRRLKTSLTHEMQFQWHHKMVLSAIRTLDMCNLPPATCHLGNFVVKRLQGQMRHGSFCDKLSRWPAAKIMFVLNAKIMLT